MSRNKRLERFARFKEKSVKKFDGFFSFDNFIFVNMKTEGDVTCPIHGDFSITPQNHLSGQGGCMKCRKDKLRRRFKKNIREFISESNEIHDNFYDYSLYNVDNSKVPGIIICPHHGKFLCSMNNHLKGHGCPRCRDSYGERLIDDVLTAMDVVYYREKTFAECKDRKLLPFDFYIPSKNLLIEYDGIQHFNPINYFGGQSRYLSQIKHDIIKNEFCKSQGIELLRIPYWDISVVDFIIKSYMCDKN